MNKKSPDYDFCGWATVNDLLCSDGRIIKKDAFKDCDGMSVPLVWNHSHNDPQDVLGHGILENRDKGVYVYGYLNDTRMGQHVKTLIEHRDIVGLSIYANQLKQQGPNVLHGNIREVSVVLAGANPGACIESVISHSDDNTEEAIIYTGEDVMLKHADEETENKAPKAEEEKEEEGKTVKQVFDALTDEQKNMVYMLVGAAVEEAKDGSDEKEEDEEDKPVKHNVFDKDTDNTNYLSHSDEEQIIRMAKSNNYGTFQTAFDAYMEANEKELAHGFDTQSMTLLYPEYKDVKPGAPEMLTTDQGWIGKVMAKVHKSPISRIRTRQADLRNISQLRAKGYEKGTQKGYVGNFSLLHRTTDPQTVYVKSKLDRDDIIDITDFDIVQYMYNIDRMNLNEELATAIMLGDGREVGTDGKISEDHIRPVWTDDELYTIHTDVDIGAMQLSLQGGATNTYFGENYIYAESIIQALLYAREGYKGSGSPDFFCTPHLVNVMLLARDRNGRRIYDNVNELAAALNVREIITCEQFEGKTRTTGNNKVKKLVGLMGNLADYSLGSTKGGEVTHFTDFDIDFNQEKSLLETRVSGALTKVKSFIALEEDVTPASSNDDNP